MVPQLFPKKNKFYQQECPLLAMRLFPDFNLVKHDMRMPSESNIIALDKLPTEILLQILEQDSLPTASIQALRQTCSRFRNVRSPPESDVSAAARDAETMSDKLEFLEMLCRDLSPSDLQACTACLRLHSRAKYSQFELAKHPYPRQCLYASKLWLCPHKRLSFSAARNILAHLDDCKAQDLKECRNCHLHMCTLLYKEGDGGALVQRVDLRLLESNQYVEVLTIDAIKEQFAAAAVTTLLEDLDVPICSHMLFSDPSFTKRYDPDRLELRRHLGPLKWMGTVRSNIPFVKKKGTRQRPWRCAERDCGTEFWFELRQIKQSINDSEVLTLISCVRRSIGPMTHVTDKEWLQHTISEVEQKAMLRSWDVFFANLKHERQERQAFILRPNHRSPGP